MRNVIMWILHMGRRNIIIVWMLPTSRKKLLCEYCLRVREILLLYECCLRVEKKNCDANMHTGLEMSVLCVCVFCDQPQ